MPNFLITLPPGYTVEAVLDHSSTTQVWEIRNGEARAGYIIGLEWLQIIEWFPPEPTPTPTPPVETWKESTYIIQVDSLNIRGEPDTSGISRGKLPLGKQIKAAVRTPQLLADNYEWAKVTDMSYPANIGYIAIHKVDADGKPIAPILAKPSATAG